MVNTEPTNQKIYNLLLEFRKEMKEGDAALRQEMKEGFAAMDVRLSTVEVGLDDVKGTVQNLQKTVERNHDELLSHKDWSTSHIVNMDEERAVGAHQAVNLEDRVEKVEGRVKVLEGR